MIKDNMDVAGVKTTHGSRWNKDDVAKESDAIIKAYDDLGFIYKSGKNGQCIYVSPKNDMAVVWFSNVYNNALWLPIYARAIVNKPFRSK